MKSLSSSETVLVRRLLLLSMKEFFDTRSKLYPLKPPKVVVARPYDYNSLINEIFVFYELSAGIKLKKKNNSNAFCE